jgi:inosine-uridine nucleoside N-ribohydrolase
VLCCLLRSSCTAMSLPAASPSATSSARKAVWLDCDPGHDDAIAIVLAGYSSKLRLLGISTVAGNAPVDCTTANALNVCHVSGLGYVPVVQGAARPLLRSPRFAAVVHGETGLHTPEGFSFPPLPADRKPVASKAINYMYHCIHNHVLSHPMEKVTLVAVGCLTNIALLLAVYPEVGSYLHEIVILGGSCSRGNTGAMAEFNMLIDPEAASSVFNNTLVPVVMVPLDVTHSAIVTESVLRCVCYGGTDISNPPLGIVASGFGSGHMRELQANLPPLDKGDESRPFADLALSVAVSPYRKLVVGLLQYFRSTYKSVFEMEHPPLHDPCALAYVIDRSMFNTKKCRVDVETSSPFSAGQTVVDLLNVGNHPESAKNVLVALSMDVTEFWKLVLEAINAADARSILNPLPTPFSRSVSSPLSPVPNVSLSQPRFTLPITRTPTFEDIEESKEINAALVPLGDMQALNCATDEVRAEQSLQAHVQPHEAVAVLADVATEQIQAAPEPIPA